MKCRSPVLWAEIGESSLIGPELVQETTDKVFEVGDRVMLKVSPWKGDIRFGKKGKLAPRYAGPFEILERIGPVAYRLRLPEELSGVHDTFHVFLRSFLDDGRGSGSWMFLFVWSGYAAMGTLLWAGKVVSMSVTFSLLWIVDSECDRLIVVRFVSMFVIIEHERLNVD
ncbi:hypothetical protein Tco_0169333 [Tanacetum coccineum]